MSEREYFINKLKKSRSTVISYTSDSISTLDEILDEIGSHKIKDISHELILDSYIREHKISSLLDNKINSNFNYLVIDTLDIIYSDDKDNTFSGISSILVSSILDNIYIQSINKNIKLIILTPFIKLINKSPGDVDGINSKIIRSVYNSDLYLTIQNNQAIIIKDRNDDDSNSNKFLNLTK